MYLILYIIKGHIHAWQELSRIKDTYPELKDISGVIYKRSLAVVGRSIYYVCTFGKSKEHVRRKPHTNLLLKCAEH